MLTIYHRTRNYWISLILNCCGEVAHYFNPWFRASTNIECLGIYFRTILNHPRSHCSILNHPYGYSQLLSHPYIIFKALNQAQSHCRTWNHFSTPWCTMNQLPCDCSTLKKSHLSAVFWSKIQNYSMQNDDVPLCTRLFTWAMQL